MTYERILQSLDELEQSQVLLLLGELQARIAKQPKRSLREFQSEGLRTESSDGWITKLRQEWED